jgi:hypothetical protein
VVLSGGEAAHPPPRQLLDRRRVGTIRRVPVAQLTKVATAKRGRKKIGVRRRGDGRERGVGDGNMEATVPYRPFLYNLRDHENQEECQTYRPKENTRSASVTTTAPQQAHKFQCFRNRHSMSMLCPCFLPLYISFVQVPTPVGACRLIPGFSLLFLLRLTRVVVAACDLGDAVPQQCLHQSRGHHRGRGAVARLALGRIAYTLSTSTYACGSSCMRPW